MKRSIKKQIWLSRDEAEMLKKKETIENLVNRVIETKLTKVLKPQVTLEEKSISAADFNKMFA